MPFSSPSHSSSNTLHSTHHSSSLSLFPSPIQPVVLDSKMHLLAPTINTHPILTHAKASVFKRKTYQANASIELSTFQQFIKDLH